jgi:hypothetical protein
VDGFFVPGFECAQGLGHIRRRGETIQPHIDFLIASHRPQCR